jgi:ubiquitin-conjugating enzyme E2 variant
MGTDQAPTAAKDAFAVRKQNAAVLASQYTRGKRAMEIFSVSAFAVLLIVNVVILWPALSPANLWVVVMGCVLAMVFADVYSGLAHWGADSWGSVATPLVGKSFIRSFREHHVDPHQITCHDLIETNGDNCLAAVPLLAVLAYSRMSGGDPTALKEVFIHCFLAFLCIWVALTNQIHKWSHMRTAPGWVSWLQETKVILSKKNHQQHHHTPFDRYYCITTGWLNPVLGSIGFWKRVENHITAVSCTSPRTDDAYWTAQDPQD